MIRLQLQELEEKILSPFAALSSRTRGREHPEEECEIRTPFQRDRDRVIHSKAFRRLKHKTQVFISPEGDHYRTRLTHTLEVAQIARTVARALRLNEDLTEAIALGHDLGHTPFGHAGEDALNSVYRPGFRHNEQSLRVVERLERRTTAFPGLNLTWEVRDGIRHHTGNILPATLEGRIIRIADRIAYINHDIDDAIRAGVITQEQLPQECIDVLGTNSSARIDHMVKDLIASSLGQPDIRMSPKVQEATDRLRSFLFEKVYIGSLAKAEEGKAKAVLQSLFGHFVSHPGELAGELGVDTLEDVERAAVDFIAGMTDRYAIAEYSKHFLPSAWSRY